MLPHHLLPGLGIGGAVPPIPIHLHGVHRGNFIVTVRLAEEKCILFICSWPRGLRRGSAAARLLGLWVGIPPGAWMCVVSVVCCQVEVSATG